MLHSRLKNPLFFLTGPLHYRQPEMVRHGQLVDWRRISTLNSNRAKRGKIPVMNEAHKKANPSGE